MKIVPAEDFGVIASVPHRCGHVVEMFYTEERFALADEPIQAKRMCIYCTINAERGALDKWREGDTL